MTRLELPIEPLTKAAFMPFGQVIETDGATQMTINRGHATRFHDLAQLDLIEAGGQPLINVFRANPWPMPIRIETMERHPLSSQAFVPLGQRPFLVVVARPGEPPAPEEVRAFLADGGQGVNYARGVWHHPLLALEADADFLVIDRGGDEPNCDEVAVGNGAVEVVLAPLPGAA